MTLPPNQIDTNLVAAEAVRVAGKAQYKPGDRVAVVCRSGGGASADNVLYKGVVVDIEKMPEYTVVKVEREDGTTRREDAARVRKAKG